MMSPVKSNIQHPTSKIGLLLIAYGVLIVAAGIFIGFSYAFLPEAMAGNAVATIV